MSALMTFIVTSIIGLGLLCAGVFVLAGPGWALISGAGSMLAIAAFIRRGMTDV